jgi:ribonuclease P protein subunit RPR2
LTFAEARRDALTGLANRRAFDEYLARAVAGGEPVAVGLFDLDDFKRVNDSAGHGVGDEVLRELGRVVLRTLRIEEEAFRVGGDEFAFVIAGDSPQAARVGDRLRRGLARQRRGHPLPTVSMGIAAIPGEARTQDDLLRRADAALYAAKWAGKDRIVVYTGEVQSGASPPPAAEGGPAPVKPLRLLVVDDDAALRLLLRTTFEVVDIAVDEAGSADEAERAIVASLPDVVVLDVGLPGLDGVEFCRRLRRNPATRELAVVLLTGSDSVSEVTAEAAGADALLRKPFSPLELLGVVERLAGGLDEGPFHGAAGKPPEEQLLLYAQDLRRLLQIERKQRVMLQRAYRQTVAALASALDSKDSGTAEHSERVRRYASELSKTIDPLLLDDVSLEYGFLLHDVGKIGIPEKILHKPGPLTEWEARLMQRHPVVGESMLDEVALLQGEGLRVVRHHHERWDGFGYPDGLGGGEIPLGARIFAVADALDAITSDRPYRRAGSWDDAVAEIVSEASLQFDPDVVEAFRESEPGLRRIHGELTKTK